MSNKNNKPINRGRDAEKPYQIPFAGWKDIGKRVFSEMKVRSCSDRICRRRILFFSSLIPYDSCSDFNLQPGSGTFPDSGANREA